jgi:DNA repair protein RadC
MNKSLYVKLDEFEREMTIENYQDVITLMRSLYNREFELVSGLPNVPNHEAKMVAYAQKYAGIHENSKRQPILRSQQPIALDQVEFMWTIGLSADCYIAFIALNAIGNVHSVTANPFEVFKNFAHKASNRAIVVHTHPNDIGPIKPNDQDLNFTKSLLYMAGHAQITLSDHVILSRTSHYSFVQEGMINRLRYILDNELKDSNELLSGFNQEKKEYENRIAQLEAELSKYKK